MPHTIINSRIHRKNGTDSDGSTVTVDNSDNTKIFSEEDIFTENIYPIISNGVAAIGGKYLHLKGIGTVIWSWNYDKGKRHTNKL